MRGNLKYIHRLALAVLRLRGMEKIFKTKFFKIFKIIYDPLIIDFPKFAPLTATGMALCVNQNVKIYSP
jgi:hypothetical protein